MNGYFVIFNWMLFSYYIKYSIFMDTKASRCNLECLKKNKGFPLRHVYPLKYNVLSHINSSKQIFTKRNEKLVPFFSFLYLICFF